MTKVTKSSNSAIQLRSGLFAESAETVLSGSLFTSFTYSQKMRWTAENMLIKCIWRCFTLLFFTCSIYWKFWFRTFKLIIVNYSRVMNESLTGSWMQLARFTREEVFTVFCLVENTQSTQTGSDVTEWCFFSLTNHLWSRKLLCSLVTLDIICHWQQMSLIQDYK